MTLWYASDLRDFANVLRTGQVTTSTCFCTLTTFEMKSLYFLQQFFTVAKTSTGKLIEVPGVGFLFFRQHTAFTRADSCTSELRTFRKSYFGLLG